jgi:signal transduction histidine kinase
VTLVQKLREVLADRPRLGDAAVAITFTVVMLVGLQIPPGTNDRSVDILAIVLVVIPGILTAFRRTHPVASLAVATVLSMTYWVLDYSGAGAGFAVVVLLYSTAVYSAERRRSSQVLMVFTITMFAVLLAGYISPDEEEVTIGVIVLNLVLFQFAWLAGDAVRNRRAQMFRLEGQIEQAEKERQDTLNRAVDEERNRIARELHDVVAHAMSVIVVQAEGASRLVGKDEESVKTALAAIEHTGRANLNDIRGIVGLLRTDGNKYAPSPELSMVDQLVDQCSEAGLSVSLDVQGTPRSLPPMIELSGYRIVQESLTNAIKHAGPTANAKVTIGYHEDSLDIAVVDDGRGAATEAQPTPGHGLLGIRERVEAFGGQIRTGPRVGGGFAVEARIPIESGR